MKEKDSTFIDREPRYKHLKSDDNLIRVRMHLEESDFECRYQDLSMTGIRFRSRIPLGLKPGDSVELHIPPPAKHIVWENPDEVDAIIAKAIVTRCDGDREFSAQFDKIDDKHRFILQEGIRAGINAAKLEPIRKVAVSLKDFFVQRWSMMVLLILTSVIALAAISWLSAPRGNYTPDHTIPWASRTF